MQSVCMFWRRDVTLNFTDYQKWLRKYFFLYFSMYVSVFLCFVLSFFYQFSVISIVVVVIIIIIIIIIINIIICCFGMRRKLSIVFLFCFVLFFFNCTYWLFIIVIIIVLNVDVKEQFTCIYCFKVLSLLIWLIFTDKFWLPHSSNIGTYIVIVNFWKYSYFWFDLPFY